MKFGMHHLSIYVGASFSPEPFHHAPSVSVQGCNIVILEVPGGQADYAAIFTS